MSLKYRQTGQNSSRELNERDLRRELDKREEEHLKAKQKGIQDIEEEEKKVDIRLLTNAPAAGGEETTKYDDADAVDSDDDLDTSRLEMIHRMMAYFYCYSFLVFFSSAYFYIFHVLFKLFHLLHRIS